MDVIKATPEENIENAIRYFKNLYLNPPKDLQAELHEILKARVNRMLEGHAQPATKSAIMTFVNRFGDEVIDFIIPDLKDACGEVCRSIAELKQQARNLATLQDNIESRQDDLGFLENMIRHHQELIKKLETDFPDPRARSAYQLYTKISTPDVKDDTYTKQRRITSAGLVAAAFLGLERYEINPAKQPKQD